MQRHALSAAVLSVGLFTAFSTHAGEAPWAPADSPTYTRVHSEKQLVVHVYVPLCSNDQVNCGSTLAGEPANLEHNLYWGAIFGQKRFFSRKASTFTSLALETKGEVVLERAAFHKSVAGAPWGLDEQVELVVVFDAYHGSQIDQAIDDFYREAEGGNRLTLHVGDNDVTYQVDVVGYAGHNRMMDGKTAPEQTGAGAPLPSFVMACDSKDYFSEPLAARGSSPLLLTRDLMAPEGYVVDAIALALGDNASKKTLRDKTVQAYARWQSIEASVAGRIFAPN
ncbi:MAG: hypothetical protein U0271_41070 [Polyangiaceae bacterium]